MQNYNNVPITFGFQNLYHNLTDNPENFMKTVCKEFQIKQFTAEVEMKNQQQKINLEFRNPNQVKKEDMIHIIKQGCKRIKIIEYKEEKNPVKQYKFFDAFINGNDVQCCKSRECQLCEGYGSIKFQENDYQFINEVIRNKLKERLLDISEIIFQRDNIKITTPEDFLNYHQNAKNVYSEFMTITPQTYKQNSAFGNIEIKQDNRYKVKIIELFDIEGEQCSEVIVQLKYMNDGLFLNWPEKIQLVCNEGPFQIRQDVKSAFKQQVISSNIKIHIPDIPPKKYQFKCKFEYENEEKEKIQFGDSITLNLTVKEKMKQKITAGQFNYDEENKKLIPQIERQLFLMGYDQIQMEQKKINEIFKRCAHRELNLESFLDEFLK